MRQLSKLKGKSSPDFVGQQADTRSWHIFEAKARNTSAIDSALKQAREQADRNMSVDGNTCELKVGSVLYREGSTKKLRFVWDDPADDEEPVHNLDTGKQTWAGYYANAWNLADLQEADPKRFLEEFGFVIELAEPVKRLRANIKADKKTLENSLGELRASATERRLDDTRHSRGADDWNGDGIRILQVRERRQFGVEG